MNKLMILAAVAAVGVLVNTSWSSSGESRVACTNSITLGMGAGSCTNQLSGGFIACGGDCTNKLTANFFACGGDCTNKLTVTKI